MGKAHKYPLPSTCTCGSYLHAFLHAPQKPAPVCAHPGTQSCTPWGHPKMPACFLTPVCMLALLLMWGSTRDPHLCCPSKCITTSLRQPWCCPAPLRATHLTARAPPPPNTQPHTLTSTQIHAPRDAPSPATPRHSSFLSFPLSNPFFTPRDALISPREDGGSGGMPAGPGGTGCRGAGSGMARLPMCSPGWLQTGRECPEVRSDGTAPGACWHSRHSTSMVGTAPAQWAQPLLPAHMPTEHRVDK